MSLQPELFKAILAMDAYNRGYDASIELNGTQVGNAAITTDSVLLGTTEVNGETIDRHETIGFYALAYDYNGETVISYRGTDYPTTEPKEVVIEGVRVPVDIFYGWTLGSGYSDSPQGKMAVEFYHEVLKADNGGVAIDPRMGNVSLTGHSLGGGLAGYLGSLYHKKADVFDSMTFSRAANETYDDVEFYVPLIEQGRVHAVRYHLSADPSSPMTDYITAEQLQDFEANANIIIESERNILDTFDPLIYGGSTPWEPDDSRVDGYYMNKEILDKPCFCEEDRPRTEESQVRMAGSTIWEKMDRISMSLILPCTTILP